MGDKHEKYSLAAKKAWETIRKKRIQELKEEYAEIDAFLNFDMKYVKIGEYEVKHPLIKKSKLASKEKGGIGKDLSEGWAINFAIGCTHACIFCYADSLHKRVYGKKYKISGIPWGFYLLKPKNIDEAIEKTNWTRWKGKEVLMSSTHDPYLPQLYPIPRRILEAALPEGVRFCIQTRSPLVLKDLDLLIEYKEQVRLQVSISTYYPKFARLIEPRVPPPNARFEIIKKAKEKGIDIGVIIAPIFPPNPARKNMAQDLDMIMKTLAEINPDHIYGEMLHARGANLIMIESLLNTKFKRENLLSWDSEIEYLFYNKLAKYGLSGDYWPEHRKSK